MAVKKKPLPTGRISSLLVGVSNNPTTDSPAAVDLHRGGAGHLVIDDEGRVNRSPPHSVEAEQGVMGCILLAPNDNLGLCLEKLKAGADCFYDVRHQVLFRLLVQMHDRNDAIDLVTVHQRLQDNRLLEEAGGAAYLSSLPEMVPSAANLGYYLEILREKYLLRKVIQTCTRLAGNVFECEGEVERFLDEVERQVLQISQEREEHVNRSIKDLVNHAINTVEEFQERKGLLTGLATGFTDLDRMSAGLHEGEMIVIAARPSMGKTSFALNIAEYVSVEQRLPVGVFSLEMTAESLVLRMLCSRAEVNLRSMREGFLVERDFPKLTGAASRLAGAPLFIDDTPALSILQLRARARRMAKQHGIKLFVVDYLQLLHSTSRRAENRQQEIADISSGLKALAKELKIPVVVLSQLNREIEKEKNRKPRLSDLRESGSIEQDADLVGLLYKPESSEGRKPGEEDESQDADVVPVNLLVAKQRNGPTGDVRLTFFRGITRFRNAPKIGAGDVPMDA
ncbi:MAG TPA: replicative DNA helicase [Verrucomicrobiota bacterium]|nr:replicative DNA helicase [Verrucomicrobiota bacterium]